MLSQMSYKGTAAGKQLPEQDSNLHLRDPESRVLPIRRPGIIPAKVGRQSTGGESRTLTSCCSPGFESGAVTSYATPACAARDLNPELAD
jgi:hypothetical protein